MDCSSLQRWPGSDVFKLGTVHNVVVRLPGTASTRAILLNAHFDGSATGPAASSGFDASHPRPNSIAYALDADTNKAVWVSIDPEPDNWTSQFFPAGAEKNRTAAWYLSGKSAFQVQAPVVLLSPPEVIVLNRTSDGGMRTLLLQITSPRGAVYTHIDIKTKGQIELAEVDGKPLDLSKFPYEKRNRLNFFYYGLPEQGIGLTLKINSTEPVTITVDDISSGLPAIPGMTIAPRPADTMPTPGQILLDPAIVRKSFVL